MRHPFSKMRASIVESPAHGARRRKPNRIRGLTQLNPFFFLLFSVAGVCNADPGPSLHLLHLRVPAPTRQPERTNCLAFLVKLRAGIAVQIELPCGNQRE